MNSNNRIAVIRRVDHGLDYKKVPGLHARYESHFEDGTVIYSNALPDSLMFKIAADTGGDLQK